jgi:hypothetical protein
MAKTYQEINGTSYDGRTDFEVIKALESARVNKLRVRIFLGDVATGKAWNEENDVAGTIGRSTGLYKVPLLIANSRSLGGGAILDHCIVRIQTAAAPFRVLYSHPKFHTSRFEIKPLSSFAQAKYLAETRGERVYRFEVLADGECYANCPTEAHAKRLVAFMTGQAGRV